MLAHLSCIGVNLESSKAIDSAIARRCHRLNSSLRYPTLRQLGWVIPVPISCLFNYLPRVKDFIHACRPCYRNNRRQRLHSQKFPLEGNRTREENHMAISVQDGNQPACRPRSTVVIGGVPHSNQLALERR